MNPWKLTYDKFVPEKQKLREALFTLGNGYFGTRGAGPESPASTIRYPGTYIAGVYNELVSEIAGKKISNEDFVNCPNWLMLNYRIGDDPWFDRLQVKILSWRKELNIHRGVLIRRMRFQDQKGRITLVENERIVSMADPHFGAMRCTIIAENHNEPITVRSGLDGLVVNANVERYKQLNSKHLEPCSLGPCGEDGVYLQMQTNQSKIQITEAQRTIIYENNERIHPKINMLMHGRYRIIQEFTVPLKEGRKCTIDKIVSIYTSRDHGVADNCEAAQQAVQNIETFEQLYKPHQARWRAFWKKFDIEVKGDPFMQQALRLHTFHLLQVASTYNEEIDAGLPARGLHGEAYRGHIFWDEMYVFPFYNLRVPEITRALLMYRYRRLDAARENARQSGFKGAMFPWQSGSRGDETSQVIHFNPMSSKWDPDYSSLQRHVNIAVAYNIWTYYYTSGDKDFMDRYGAEMFLSIAYFWSSATTYNQKTKRFEINNVMGPDEFHEKYPGAEEGGLNNNAYTNIMVVWLLLKALAYLDDMPDEEKSALLFKIGIDADEIERWQEIAQRMTVPIEKDGLLHQFDGYMNLKELNWDEYRAKYGDIHRIDRILKAEGTSPDEYKVSKQADALMIFYLLRNDEIHEIFKHLGYPCVKDMLKKNYDYYVKRTSHGSTLSRVVHGYLAKRLGYRQDAKKFFMDALRSDIDDIQGGTTQEGIHTGVMGGTIDVFLKCFVGLSFQNDCFCLEPEIPKEWKSVKCQVRYRDTRFQIEATPKKLFIKAQPLQNISLQSPSEIPIRVNQKLYKLKASKQLCVSLQKSSASPSGIKKFIKKSSVYVRKMNKK